MKTENYHVTTRYINGGVDIVYTSGEAGYICPHGVICPSQWDINCPECEEDLPLRIKTSVITEYPEEGFFFALSKSEDLEIDILEEYLGFELFKAEKGYLLHELDKLQDCEKLLIEKR